MEKFFLVVPVNMERLALYELVRHLSSWGLEEPQFEFFPGGIEVHLPMEIGLKLNSFLKIPVRILLRVLERETPSEKDFEQLIRDADLMRFSPLGDVHVSSRSSFLRFKKSLEETVYDIVPYKPKQNGGSVFVRFFRDVCTVSVNVSGEDLFRRGYDKWVGDAPVRDNIASGLLQLLLKNISIKEQVQLIDPMAGSGTFLLEAFNKDQPLHRKFAYDKWPDPIKINTTAMFDKPNWELLACDQSKEHIEIIRHNAEVAGVKISIEQEDLFKAKKRGRSDIPRIVICNPPYGKRLKTSGHKDYFKDVLSKIAHVYAPERIGMLTPRVWLEHDDYEKMYVLDIENSGVETRFTVFYKN